MRKAPVVILAALLAAASAQGPEAAKTEKSAPMKLAFAGVKIALPAEFKLMPIESGNMLLRAAKVRGEEPLLQITLLAYHEAPSTALADFAKSRSLSKDFRVRDFRMLKSMPVKMAGVDGEAQVQSYRLRGIETTALALYFLRPVVGDKGQVGYVLMVEAKKKNGKLTLPALMAVMKTIELFDPVSPLAEPLDPLYEPIVSEKWGYSLRPPTWWKVSMSLQEEAIKIFQLDYTFAVKVHPELHFAAIDAPGRSVAQCTDEAISRIGADLTKKRATYKLLSRQVAKLAGIDGEEFVIRYSEAPSPGRPDVTPGTLLVTQRVICHAGKSYSLTCHAEMDDVKVASRILDAVSVGMKLTTPSTRPAATSAPALAPVTPSTAPAIRIVPPAPAPPTTAPATVKPATAPKTITPAQRKEFEELKKLIPG